MNLNALFSPASIAVVGVSDKPGMGRNAALGINKSSIADHVYFVNPKRDEVLGKKCYHSLGELPEIVDCMVLCINAKLVLGYIEEAGRMGIKAAVVYASGFAEEGTEEGKALEEAVGEACRKYGMLLCGPNCVGLYNKIDLISCYASDGMLPLNPLKKGLGVVAHSGYIGSNLMRTMPDLCAYGVSVGNGTICTLEQYLLFYARNDHVNCIAAYIEGIKDVAVFTEALRICALRRKPVVILKSGKSKKGSAAAASHTGNLAGNSQVFESVLKRYGAVSVESLEEFLCTARMFAVLGENIPKQCRIGAVNFSGGENTLCADFCEQRELELPDFEEQTIERMKTAIPAYSVARNPLDPTTDMFTKPENVRTIFKAVYDDSHVDIFVLGLEMAVIGEPKDTISVDVLRQLHAEGYRKPTLIVPSFEKARNDSFIKELEEIGIPQLSTGVLAYTAIRHLKNFISYVPGEHCLDQIQPPGEHKTIISLSEADSKQEISGAGIVPVPLQLTAADEKELRENLRKMKYPLVLKVDSPDILHKTDAGGVCLGIQDEENAVKSFHEIIRNCREFAPDAKIHGVLIQEMVPAGREMILGIQNDQQFGPVILVGLGGIFVEVFKDVVLSPCPVNEKEARAMLSELKGYKLLEGYRGAAACDIDALADVIVRLSEYAVLHRDEIAEVDLNPVFVYEDTKGVIAADALVVRCLK